MYMRLVELNAIFRGPADLLEKKLSNRYAW